MEHKTLTFEVKAIDYTGRTLEGYAAAFGNLDQVFDPPKKSVGRASVPAYLTLVPKLLLGNAFVAQALLGHQKKIMVEQASSPWDPPKQARGVADENCPCTAGALRGVPAVPPGQCGGALDDQGPGGGAL